MARRKRQTGGSVEDVNLAGIYWIGENPTTINIRLGSVRLRLLLRPCKPRSGPKSMLNLSRLSGSKDVYGVLPLLRLLNSSVLKEHRNGA